jgi:hypothetical protein
MSHNKLRNEKECLNCGTFVEDRFCPHCGQENTVNRPKFHYLFTHFFEDLTHYDGKFWKTLNYLFFKPGFLVNEYLLGKRKSFVNPIRLYIFVSFITFFVPFILPNFHATKKENKEDTELINFEESNGIEYGGYKNIKTVKTLDSIQQLLPANKKDSLQYGILRGVLVGLEKDSSKHTNTGLSAGKYRNITSLEQLDSIHKNNKSAGFSDWVSYKFLRKLVELKKNGNSKEKFFESFLHNLPKVLFIYLPIFALLIWLFHNKKKWFYYDHGVFTLYYFSLLLLMITGLILLNWIFTLFGNIGFFSSLISFLSIAVFIYSFYYFFRAHKVVYKESKTISRVKGLSIFFINFFVILFIVSFYTIFIFINL